MKYKLLPMMMTSCFPSWAALICGFSSVCVSVGMEMPETSSVSIIMHQWSIKTSGGEGGDPDKRELEVKLKVAEKTGWRIAYCGVDKSSLSLTDSDGLLIPRLTVNYTEGRMSERSEKVRRILLSTESWLPSANVRWIKVTGEVPVAVFRTSAVSEPVSLKLVKGFSVPLVLKGAGIDGGDMEVKVKVDDFEKDQYKENRFNLTLCVTSGTGVGILDADVQEKGDALAQKKYEYVSISANGRCSWRKTFVLDGIREDELDVSVTYATGLKSMVVPVHTLGGLFGMREPLEISK